MVFFVLLCLVFHFPPFFSHHNKTQKNTFFLFFSTATKKTNTNCHTQQPHNTTQHSTTTQHNTTQHSTTQHSTTQHSTTQHSTTQHNTAQHTRQVNLESIQTQIERIFPLATTWKDQFELQSIAVLAGVAQGHYTFALTSGLALCRNLDLSDVQHPSQVPSTNELSPLINQVAQLLQESCGRREDGKVDLQQLKLCVDEKARARMRTLYLIGEAAYYSGGDMRHLVLTTQLGVFCGCCCFVFFCIFPQKNKKKTHTHSQPQQSPQLTTKLKG